MRCLGSEAGVSTWGTRLVFQFAYLENRDSLPVAMNNHIHLLKPLSAIFNRIGSVKRNTPEPFDCPWRGRVVPNPKRDSYGFMADMRLKLEYWAYKHRRDYCKKHGIGDHWVQWSKHAKAISESFAKQRFYHFTHYGTKYRMEICGPYAVVQRGRTIVGIMPVSSSQVLIDRYWRRYL